VRGKQLLWDTKKWSYNVGVKSKDSVILLSAVDHKPIEGKNRERINSPNPKIDNIIVIEPENFI